MKLWLMTDLEGVAGVINSGDYLSPAGRYYEKARRLVTGEVNAAIDGFAAAGFKSFLVVDGHGNGAVDIELLDRRAELARGWGARPYPFNIDRTFDAGAYVGQHAKAGTPFSHLTHTGWWSVLDSKLNGVSIGEYGEGALCAGEVGVPLIFASGEQALCDEAKALTPWVRTVAVLRGVIEGTGDELSGEDYEHYHQAAIHLQPEEARERIRNGAFQAGQSFAANRDAFKPLRFDPPYKLERWNRPYKGNPANKTTREHATSIVDLLNGR